MTRSLEQALLQGADLSAMQGHSLLVNGFHNVSQENGTSAKAVSNSGAYITDQHAILTSLSVTGQQVANPFPSQPDIPFGLKLSIATAAATLAASDYLQIYQPIEGTNLARLLYGTSAAKTVTVAFMARASVATVGYFSLRSLNASGTILRTYLARFALAANTDTFVYLTIPGDVAQALLTTTAESLRASWSFGCGSTYQGAAGQWVSGSLHAGSDVTNLAATVGNSVILSGAVMFPGIVPIAQSMLPLLARRYDDELRLCRRYWESGGYSLLAAPSGAGGYTSNLIMHTEKRAAPTVVGTIAVNQNMATGPNFANNGPANNSFRVWGTCSAAGNSELSGLWQASSRM